MTSLIHIMVWLCVRMVIFLPWPMYIATNYRVKGEGHRNFHMVLMFSLDDAETQNNIFIFWISLKWWNKLLKINFAKICLVMVSFVLQYCITGVQSMKHKSKNTWTIILKLLLVESRYILTVHKMMFLSAGIIFLIHLSIHTSTTSF